MHFADPYNPQKSPLSRYCYSVVQIRKPKLREVKGLAEATLQVRGRAAI